jgi:SAM-dependent methyltransferase
VSETDEALRRKQAASFGTVAAEYDFGRPRYPVDAVRWLIRDAGLIVELGAGTGKLTASLAALAPVIATEPLTAMLDVLRHNVPTAFPVIAAAEAIPLRAAVADVVVAAQAYHWFDGPTTLRSAARVLRPGGAVGLIWNSRDDSVPWVSELSAIIGGSEQLQPGWAGAFAESAFGPLESAQFRHSQTHDIESLCALVASRSYLVVADADKQTAVLDRVRRLVATHPDLADRATFELPYVVNCFRAELQPPT